MKTSFTTQKLVRGFVFGIMLFSASLANAQTVSNGFADVAGKGLNATTGGAGGTAVTVKTFADLKKYCESTAAYIITVEGAISGSGAIAIKSNKTIQGKGKTAKLSGFSLGMNSVSNIIISDLYITGGVDGIAARNTHHLWIDHCEVWDCSDGLIDITVASSFCTVSWCKLYYVNQTEHRLACLIGNGGGTAPNDWGNNKVTYHHNWFGTKVDQRQPRLMYGQGHVYNNYYSCTGNSYCVGVGSYGMALIENNNFKGVKNPHQFMYDLFCHITAKGNVYDNTTGAKDTGLGGTRKETGQDFNVTPFASAPYKYAMDNASSVPSLVMATAGPRAAVVTSLDETEQIQEASIFPNPTKTDFNVVLPTMSDIQLVDIEGTIIEEHKNVSNLTLGNNLKSGLYFLKTDKKVFKVVKE
jgi:pectate lyase